MKGKMAKTTPGYCKKCKYACVVGAVIGCDYYLTTGKSRGDKIGYCDKFESKKKRRRKELIL